MCYDLSVLSTSMIGFQKVLMEVGGVSSIVVGIFYIFFNFAKLGIMQSP